MRTVAAILALLFAMPLLDHVAAEISDDDVSLAALSWLKLVDNGKYADSYKRASSLFQNSMTAVKWSETLESGRKPLGSVMSRTEKSREYANAVPRAPDGEYFLIRYDTSFEKKKVARETLTLMLESDGSWRVAGYFIR